jgi:hypothetical protein
VSFHWNSDPYADHAVTIEGDAAVDELAASPIDDGAEVDKYRGPLGHWGRDLEVAAQFKLVVWITPTSVGVW